MEIRTLPEARWSCRGCGACCHGFSFGPVEPEVIAHLEATDIASRWPPAAAQPWHTLEPGPDGEPAPYLAQVDGHCVFLQDDQRCAVHRLLGAAHKPWFCREYPLLPVEDGRGGLSVTVRSDCGGLHESFDDGQPVAEQVPAVLALARTVPRWRLDAPRVQLRSGVALDARRWRPLEAELLDHLANPGSPLAAVAAARAHLTTRAGLPAVHPDPARFRRAMAEVFAALLTDAPHRPPDGPPDASLAVVRARARWDGSLPSVTPAAARYLRVVLRSALLSRQFELVGSVAALVGLWLVKVTVSALHADGPPPLDPPALGATLPRLERWLQQGEQWSVVVEQQKALEDLFDHAAPA